MKITHNNFTSKCRICNKTTSNAKKHMAKFHGIQQFKQVKSTSLQPKYEPNDAYYDNVEEMPSLPMISKMEFKCHFCNEEFESNESLEKHYLYDHAVGGQDTSNIVNNVHTAAENSLEKVECKMEFKCDICDKLFESLESLDNHINSNHSPNSNKLDIKAETTDNITDTIQHICEFCEGIFDDFGRPCDFQKCVSLQNGGVGVKKMGKTSILF